MTKTELIDRLILKYPQMKAQDVEDAVRIILEELSLSLEKGDRVEIRGFGTFSLRYREGRIARNPKTGVEVKVVGKSLPYFRAGKEMRERVANPVIS